MNGNIAKLKFNQNNFEIVQKGDYVICAVSKREISLEDLNYWSVDLQEAYFSPIEAQKRYQEIKNKTE